MLNKIYSHKIIRYADEIPLQKRLVAPDATATKRSDFCGSKIDVDIMVENGKITDFGQNVEACVLGSAAASIVAEYVIGASIDEILQAQIEVWNMLKTNSTPPTGRFAKLEIMAPIADMPNRHSSTMLILDALVAAIEEV